MSRTAKKQSGENTLTSAEELKDIKETLSSLSLDVAEVLKNQKQMQQLFGTIQNLQKELKQKDEKILQLEEKIDDLEQYTRKDDIVIAGLQTRHLSYARAASRGDEAHGENASSTEVDFLEKQVVDFFKQNGIEFSSNNISTCHTLGKPRDGIKRMILVRFTNRKIKEHILRNKKKLKGTGVFVNEHLSKKNVDISIFARTLRRQNKIQNTWTRNCKVYIKTNGVPEVSSVLCIKNIIELHKFSN